jgi:hypothetical protein
MIGEAPHDAQRRHDSAAHGGLSLDGTTDLHTAGTVISEGGTLTPYDVARRALAEAKRIDDVKAICNKAEAMQVYAQRAKDASLIQDATALRMRAERRLGELLAEMKETGEREAKGGDRRSKSQPATLIPKLSDLGVTKTQSSRWQKLAELDDATFEAKVQCVTRAAILAVEGNGSQQLGGSGDNEYLTPTQYVEAARDVLGTIDLDPASCPEAQAIVQATHFFTKDEDGLQHPWRGKVFLNPPFSRDLVGRFVRKLIAECETGRVQEAVLLTSSNTSSRWFQERRGRRRRFASRITTSHSSTESGAK